MTLATITALINSKIRNKTPKVLKVEHADVEQAIVDEMYSETFIEDSTEMSEMTVLRKIFNSSTTYVYFYFLMKKEGNKCYVKGYIMNTFAQTIGNGLAIANIIDPSYEAKDTNVGTSAYIQTIEARQSDGGSCLILINNDIISINGLIPAFTRVTFDTFYLLKE